MQKQLPTSTTASAVFQEPNTFLLPNTEINLILYVINRCVFMKKLIVSEIHTYDAWMRMKVSKANLSLLIK